MGIKTLTSKLDPYCTYQTLSCSNAGCAHNARIASKGVIIDGPGLAYFIHNQLLGQNGGRNALEALPSYAELGSAVILYLSDLERFGLHTYGGASSPLVKAKLMNAPSESMFFSMASCPFKSVRLASNG